MPAALKAKRFGLPGWVWLTAIAGGVVVGLYIRERKAKSPTAATDTTPSDISGSTQDNSGAGYNTSYMPDAAGPGTSEPLDLGGLVLALRSRNEDAASAAVVPRTDTKTAKEKAKGKAKKHKKHSKASTPTSGGNSGGGNPVVGGGGPPARPKHKVKSKSPKTKGHYSHGEWVPGGKKSLPANSAIDPYSGSHTRKKRKHRRAAPLGSAPTGSA